MKPGHYREAVGVALAMLMRLVVAAGILSGAGCASGRGRGVPVDEEIKNLAGSAQVAYERGDAARAAGLYERALARARLTDDPGECARNAYNLAICRIAEGRADEARRLLAQTRGLLPSRGADTARTWLAEADAAHRQGRSEEVRQLVRRVLECGADRAGRAQAHLMLADLASGDGDGQAAHAALETAQRELRGIEAPELQARAAGIVARLARADGETAAAAAALERQAVWFKRAGRFHDMAKALAAAGEAYRAAGLMRQSYPCLLRSAASLKARGLAQAAEPTAMAALSVAQALNEPEWEAAAAALVAEIRGP